MKGRKQDQTNADDRDKNRGKPFDLADDGDLTVERQEFEQEKEIPLRARNIGCVARVRLGFTCARR